MSRTRWSIKENEIERKSVFWNMMSSVLVSVVSVFLLWVVTKVNGVYMAGVFSLGYATSQMLLTLGNFGMRNYQVTDIKGKYDMGIYLGSRVFTCIAMVIITIGIVLIKGYYLEKAVITLLLVLLKVTDAIDDVYGGYFQNNNRLDIGGKIMSIRIIAYMIAFGISLQFTKNLVYSCLIMVMISGIMLVILVVSTKAVFEMSRPKFKWKTIRRLLFESAPLCASSFFIIYIGNAPKYAIDNYLSEEMQAYFTYLFMPCFIINLFMGFALQPLLLKLSKAWMHKEYASFKKIVSSIGIGASTVSLIIILASNVVGCRLLSKVFGVSLMSFNEVLIILLVGGAFFAFSVIEQIILTVMRKQFCLLFVFTISGAVAFLISGFLVKKWELRGAACSYAISSGILFVLMGLLIIFFYVNKEKVKS